jgi:hypothetical protein
MSDMKKTVDDLRLTVSRLVRRVDQLERELSELRDRRMAKARSLGQPRTSNRGSVAVPVEHAEMSGAGTPANISADSSGEMREASETGGGGHGSSNEKPQSNEPDTPLGPRSQRHGKRRTSVKKLF